MREGGLVFKKTVKILVRAARDSYLMTANLRDKEALPFGFLQQRAPKARVFISPPDQRLRLLAAG